MSIFHAPTARRLDAGLGILRAAVGAIFVAHGAQKLFVYGFAGVSGAFAHMGVPFAAVVGPTIGLLELFGGLALVLGLLTRLAALGLALDMLGAILLVHIKAGFFLPSGAEFALSLLGAATLLALVGGGAFSVDALLGRGEERRELEADSPPVATRRAA